MSPISSPSTPKNVFFIIGAQRSGTTYLYELLETHPEIRMAQPKRPEPKWFLNPAKIALGSKGWSSSLFPKTSGRIWGEKGTSYLEHPESAKAMLQVFPQARFVVILREPVARAISHYRFSVENGVETLPIEQALTPEAQNRVFDSAKFSVSPYTYLQRGIYVNFLEVWSHLVPRAQFHVMILEELLSLPKTFEDLCHFLSIPLYLPSNWGQIVNAAVEPMPAIDEPFQLRLKAYFKEPNTQLENFLHRPLSIWKD